MFLASDLELAFLLCVTVSPNKVNKSLAVSWLIKAILLLANWTKLKRNTKFYLLFISYRHFPRIIFKTFSLMNPWMICSIVMLYCCCMSLDTRVSHPRRSLSMFSMITEWTPLLCLRPIISWVNAIMFCWTFVQLDCIWLYMNSPKVLKSWLIS